MAPVNYEDGSEVASRMPRIKLADGVEMPQLGFGTSDVKGPGEPGEPAYEAIKQALRCGYRFIDTAALYGNEHTVGRALEDALAEGLVGSREELFVCTKLWCTSHARRSVVGACRESLRRLKLTYVDLYLIHWPMGYAEEGPHPINPKRDGRLLYSDTHFTETWLGMEECKELGLARSIGLSNFNHKQCEEVLAACKHRPTVNQVELHPYLAQAELHQYSRTRDIILNAYCPLGAPGAAWAPKDKPVLIEDPLVVRLAARHARSPAQIVLRYHLQRGIAPIPKSIRPERIAHNIRVLDFQLAPDEMEALMGLDRRLRYCTNTAGEHPHDHPLYPFHEEF